MKKQMVLAASLTLALSMPLVACGSSSDSSSTSSDSTTTETTVDTDELNDFFVGQWRGSVEITGQTVYGTAGGSEQMLDVIFNDDGTCEVAPLEAHADLLTATGTWTATGTEEGSEVTLTLDDGSTITLTVSGAASLSAEAAQFDIADFETIDFDFYG